MACKQIHNDKKKKLNKWTHVAFGYVVGVVHDITGQAKVTDLHQLSLADENISGSQVTMNTLWGQGQQYRLLLKFVWVQ